MKTKHEAALIHLRRNCLWQREQGTSRDNGYPYHKHLPDCDICRAADLLEQYGKALERLGDWNQIDINDPSPDTDQLAANIQYARDTIEE